jgi:hypothetical protein
MDYQVNSTPIVPDNHKKKMMALIGLGIIGFVIVVILIATILSNGNSSQPTTVERFKSNTGIRQVTPVENSFQWKTFSTDLFSLQYPLAWKPTEYRLEDGVGYMFLPETLPDGVLSPKVSIEIVPTSRLTMDSRAASFKNSGFSQTPYTLGTIAGYKFSHVFPYKPMNGQLTNTPIEEHFIVFEHNNNLFTIGYEYDQQGASDIKQLEEKIIGTFGVK